MLLVKQPKHNRYPFPALSYEGQVFSYFSFIVDRNQTVSRRSKPTHVPL